jgi:hypothetical protein
MGSNVTYIGAAIGTGEAQDSHVDLYDDDDFWAVRLAVGVRLRLDLLLNSDAHMQRKCSMWQSDCLAQMSGHHRGQDTWYGFPGYQLVLG